MRNNYSSSGPLWAVVRVHPGKWDDWNEGIDLVAVFGKREAKPKCLSDVDWFREELNNISLADALHIEGDFAPGLWLFSGCMWTERIDSLDYGTDYDGGFEVEAVERLPDDPVQVAAALARCDIWLPPEVLATIDGLRGADGVAHPARLWDLREALDVVIDALEEERCKTSETPQTIG